MPRICAIIPVFNAASHIESAIASALTQEGVEVEVIVVDDGSTDGTWQVLESLGDQIRKERQTNGGPAAARNYGARLATTEWLAFLDADDEWLPSKAAQQFAALDHTATMVYSILFGGKQNDTGWNVAVDAAGNAYVCGATSSHNFPTNNSFGSQSSTNTGKSDAFVAVFDTNADSVFSGYLGGKGDDVAYALAVDAATNIYVVGRTLSKTFPVVAPTNQVPLQIKRFGPNDAFITIISQ